MKVSLIGRNNDVEDEGEGLDRGSTYFEVKVTVR